MCYDFYFQQQKSSIESCIKVQLVVVIGRVHLYPSVLLYLIVVQFFISLLSAQNNVSPAFLMNRKIRSYEMFFYLLK